MICSERVSRVAKASRISAAAGIAAIVLAFAIGATPTAALAKKHKTATEGAASGAVDAAAAPAAACGATFATCCTITASGTYTMSASFTANSGTGTCVAIGNAGGSITNVVVNLDGFTITQATANKGTGTGIGITGASGFNSDSQGVFLEGLNGSVGGFATGVSVSSSSGTFGTNYVTVESVNAGSNGTGFSMTGNNASISNISASSNKVGVEVTDCDNCSVNFADLESNTQYGMWLTDSDMSTVNSIFTTANGVAGIYDGCNATTPGTTCSSDTGDNNQIFNSISEDNPNTTTGLGIYVDNGETNTSVSDNDASGDKFDGFDKNTNCGSNHWFGNTFTTASPSCVH
ncbi:MAG: hypothetical protein WBE78_11575 [Candidatus Binataceae bacterium]